MLNTFLYVQALNQLVPEEGPANDSGLLGNVDCNRNPINLKQLANYEVTTARGTPWRAEGARTPPGQNGTKCFNPRAGLYKDI